MTRPSSVLFDKNKESWLAVEGNVIRVFTSKLTAVQYRTENTDKNINVLHRYSDGSMQPLICWENQSSEEDRPLMDLIEEYYLEDIANYEEAIDFYDLCSNPSNDPTPEA